ncbi:hypothetical protein [Fictibacillus sp. NRS-1165]|uniref:hypothetical protein n=1 Tax=Fictibacillus sp. NRS-1165 TaxID=3144463 RepID=UPI003D22C817
MAPNHPEDVWCSIYIALLLVSKKEAGYEFISSCTPEKVEVMMMNGDNKEIIVHHEDMDGIKTSYTKIERSS